MSLKGSWADPEVVAEWERKSEEWRKAFNVKNEEILNLNKRLEDTKGELEIAKTKVWMWKKYTIMGIWMIVTLIGLVLLFGIWL